jgi:hypothetical protein
MPTRHTRHAFAVLTVLTIALAATPVHACRCAGPHTPQTAYRTADAVALAEVLSLEGNFRAQGGAIATLNAGKAWKAGVPATLRVETRTTCAFDFRTGETYLVYLTRSGIRAPYSTTICRGNLRAGDAGAALGWLERRGKPAPIGP